MEKQNDKSGRVTGPEGIQPKNSGKAADSQGAVCERAAKAGVHERGRTHAEPARSSQIFPDAPMIYLPDHPL